MSSIGTPRTPAAPDEVQAVGRQVAISSALMVASRLAIRLIGVVSTLILARLLLPEDFGLIGLAAAVITIAEVMTQTGVGMAVVRRPQVDRDIYDTAWTINLLRSLLLGGLLAGTAEWQATMLGDPRIALIIMLVAFGIIFDAFASAGMYRLQRELRFGLIFRLEMVSKLVAFTLTIALALILRNYWCLVLGTFFTKFITVPYTYWLAPHRPRISFHAAGELLHFSKWMLASNACGAIEGQASNLSIGHFAGLPALGVWQISWQVAAVPVTELAVPIRGPIYAGYAKVQHDSEMLQRHFLAGFGLLGAVVTPLSVGIVMVSTEIERIALGPAFVGAAALIALCAFYALVDALAHFTFNLFIVLNRQARMVVVHALMVLVRVPAVIVGAMQAGAAGAGVALVSTAVLGAVAWHWQLSQLIGYGPLQVLRVIWRSCAAALCMAVAVLLLRQQLAPHGGSLSVAAVNLAVLASVGAVLHIGTQLLLWRLCGAPNGAERSLLTTGASLVARLRRR